MQNKGQFGTGAQNLQSEGNLSAQIVLSILTNPKIANFHASQVCITQNKEQFSQPRVCDSFSGITCSIFANKRDSRAVYHFEHIVGDIFSGSVQRNLSMVAQ